MVNHRAAALGQAVPAQTAEPACTGLSTGTKLASRAGAAALFGCYKLGRFNRSTPQPGKAAGSGNHFR